MKTKCNLLPVEDNMQSVGTAAFLQFLQPMRGISGTLMLGSQEPWNPFTVCCPTVGFSVGLSFEVCSHIICGRYVVASLDVTVFPANAERVKAAFDIISSVCSMSSSHCGWIMMPVHQAQTNQQALMKHRRHIEDSLVKASINLTSEAAILFAKPDGARDGRSMSQPARVGIHSSYMGSSPFLETSACQDARVGPCELIKITDFIGYDSEQRPGASARVEQTLGQKSGVF